MNKYIVYFETLDEKEVGLLFEIEVTVNRPNDPTDEELIMDYLKINYSFYHSSVKWTCLEEVVEIPEDYSIET